MKKIGLALLIGYSLWVPLCQAENLADIFQQARQADPVWLGQVADHKAAQETQQQSLSALLPLISLTADSKSNFQKQNFFNPALTDNRGKYNSNRWSLNLVQPIFDLSDYQEHQQAKASVRQADAELEANTQDMIIRVAEAYFDILFNISELDSVQAEKKAIARQLDQAKKRFDVGLIAITDVHEAQASYDLSTAREIEAENALSLARAALSEITGTEHSTLSDVSETLPLASPDPEDINQWITTAQKNNRSLAAAEAGVDAAQKNVKAERAGHYPTLDLIASGGNTTSHGGQFGSETNTSSIGLELNVPIYSGGFTSSRLRQALAELEQARQNHVQVFRSVKRQTINAYKSTTANISRIKALKQAVISAQSAVDATEAGFEVGTRTIVDVLNAQRNLYRAKSDYQQARYTYIITGLRLKQAAGSLSENDIAQVNSHLQ